VAIIVLSISSWFALTNHCLLATPPKKAKPESSGCPMHAGSPSKTPAKQKDCGSDSPCRKSLRALMPKTATSIADAVAFSALPFNYPVAQINFIPAGSTRVCLALDTGPPGAFSFAELILQESILAHAPPFPA
jgi:hypothetical protein